MKEMSDLTPAIRQALADIETQREKVEDLWLDAYDAWQAYHNAVAAYNSHPDVIPGDRLSVPGLDKLVATPLYLCHGLCNVPFETESLAQVSHQAYCSEKHGKSGTTGVTYWTCFGNPTCQRFSEHWKECRASNCSVMFPPPEHEHEWDTYDHKVKCTECGKKYFTCQSSTCPDSSTHSGSGSGSGGSTPPTDETPNCQDCTTHCSSPCNCGNSGTCNGTVAAPPPPPPPPEPPPPTRCSEGHLYNPNNASETEAHTVPKTCKRSGCNVSMKDCQNLGGGGCFSGGKEYKYHWL